MNNCSENNVLCRPYFTGIAGGLCVSSELDVERKIVASGLNTGNFLFVSALRLVLGDYQDIFRSEYDFRQSNKNFDYIAISAANWISADSDFGYLADFIESTDLPCIVVGLGSHNSSLENLPNLRKGTMRFLKVVSERSKYISVRGGHTQELLSKYGISNTWVTGCPSLLYNLYNFRKVVRKEFFDLKKVVLQGTRHEFSSGIFDTSKVNDINLEIYRFALRNDCFLLLQSERPDISISLGHPINNDGGFDDSLLISYLSSVFCDEFSVVSDFLSRRGKVFWNLHEWIHWLQRFDFLIGTRIHGVISALLSGVPGLLIAHDSRTVELAEVLKVPYVNINKVGSFDYDFIKNAYAEADYNSYNDNFNVYVKGFADFFNANGVFHGIQNSVG